MAMAWAKFPSAWVKITESDDLEIDDDFDDSRELSDYPAGLRTITWRDHGSSGTAALIVLFGLAIISNLSQRGGRKRQGNLVSATYTELENITGLSRAMISRGLRILEEVKAINTEKDGNRSVYALQGIDEDGKWCAIPQDHLLEGSDYLKRLQGIRETIRRPASLYAMKMYVLLLAFRDRRRNTTRISYNSISRYTGLRRDGISLGWQILASWQLGYLADDAEDPLRKGERRHNRYKIRGLIASG